MPELPEAETIARQLHQALAGRRLGRILSYRADIVHGDPQLLRKLLTGRRFSRLGVVERVHRRGKRVVLQLQGSVKLVFHLGMSGRLTIVDRHEPVEPHTHLRIEIPSTGCELRFRDPRRFGGVWCLAGSDVAPASSRWVGRKLGPLGVEPLETTAAEFRRLLNRRRQVKALLLDQRIICGLGNIYCDEALHAAGIHPLTRAEELETKRADRLLRAIKSTLNRAIRFNGSTLTDYRQADGSAGSFQKYHRVYQRAAMPCRKCGTPIQRILAAGRSTFFCPTCQTH